MFKGIRKYSALIGLIAVLSLSNAWGAVTPQVDIDSDGNGAVDRTRGGTNSILGAVLTPVTQAATDTLTALECAGTQISNYGQVAENTQTAPAAAAGLQGIVVIGTAGAGAFHFKAGPGDRIYLDGVALDDGDKVSFATPAVGDAFSFFAFQTGASAYDWYVVTIQGALTDGGA